MYSVLLFLFSLAFVVADIYFGFSEEEFCLGEPIANTKIGFTMATWLRVNGLVCLVLIVTVLALSLLIYSSESYPNLFFGYLMALVFSSCFRVAWAIIGGVMFFGYLLPRSDCSDGMEAYLFASILADMALVFANCLATRARSDMEMEALSQEAE